jgi:trimethylamine:corrinoid methyltransferase-like protein
LAIQFKEPETADLLRKHGVQFKQTETADLLRKHGGKTGAELKAEGK